MQYVIRLFDEYFLNINEGEDEFYETFSVSKATWFESREEAVSWVENQTDFEDYSECLEVTDELLRVDAEWRMRMARRYLPKLDKTGTWDYDPEKHSSRDVINFHVQILTSAIDMDSVPGQSYRSWPKLGNLFTHLMSVDLYLGGFFTFESIFPVDKSCFSTFKDELDLALSFKPTLTDAEGHIKFSVFDRFLSSGGDSVYLVVVNREDDLYRVVGSERVEGTLKTCFDFLKEYRYYGQR